MTKTTKVKKKTDKVKNKTTLMPAMFLFLCLTQQVNLTGSQGSVTSSMDPNARLELEHIKVSYAMSVTFAVGVMQVLGRSVHCCMSPARNITGVCCCTSSVGNITDVYYLMPHLTSPIL